MTTEEPDETAVPVTGHEKAAWVLMGCALLFLFHFHLVPALIAGLLVYTLLHKMTHMLHGPRLSHGAAKFVAAGLLGVLAAAATALLVVLFVGFFRGHVGDLPAVFQKMADILDQTREQLRKWGVDAAFLEAWQDATQVEGTISHWLREHSAQLSKASGLVGRLAVHVVMGIVLGLLVFFRHPEQSTRPLSAALGERVRRLTLAFEAVVFAQVEISALNTVLTAIYLLIILPIFHAHLPFSFTLVLVTFVAGLIPVAGNLISNTVIVIISLSVSPWTAFGSLGFLVIIHKLEYFTNAKIVGSRIHASAWEILLMILSFEVAFGVPGVVLAPIVYAYVKRELADKGLV